jgi:hypothetical protein
MRAIAVSRCRRFIRSLLYLSLFAVLACSAPPEQQRLERGMAFARRNLELATTSPMYNMTLVSLAQMGGGVSDYLYAVMKEETDVADFYDGVPEKPWSIGLRSIGMARIVVEGYGASLAKPILVDTVVVKPPPAP